MTFRNDSERQSVDDFFLGFHCLVPGGLGRVLYIGHGFHVIGFSDLVDLWVIQI